MSDPERLRRYAREMRREPTLAEKRLWEMVRGRKVAGLKFRRQVPIGDYIPDCVCFEPKLVLEADSDGHLETQAYDAVRDAWLGRQGFVVLRFHNLEIMEHPERIALAIRRAAGLEPGAPLDPYTLKPLS